MFETNEPKPKNVVQEAIEAVAEKRGVPIKKVKKEALEELDKLRKSGVPAAEQSADEQEKLIRGEENG